MKTTIRLSLLLLMAILSIVTLGRAQDATSSSATWARRYDTGEPLQDYLKTSAPLGHAEKSLPRSWAMDHALQWKMNLALRLVKHRALTTEQVRIILDALSLSSSQIFAATSAGPARKEPDALQALRRRTRAAFSKKEAADLFTHLTDAKADDDVLQKYYDFSVHPLKERKALFRNASSKDQSELWRTQLALSLVRSDLNQWQKQIILSAMSLVTPEFFEVRANSPAWKTRVRVPLRGLEEQILAAFSFEDAAMIFAQLGDDTEAAKGTVTPSGSVLLSSIKYHRLNDAGPYKDRSRNRLAEQDMFAGPPCECSMDSDWCPISSYCNGGTCSPTQSGCGTLWSYPCNGASCR